MKTPPGLDARRLILYSEKLSSLLGPLVLSELVCASCGVVVHAACRAFTVLGDSTIALTKKLDDLEDRELVAHGFSQPRKILVAQSKQSKQTCS